LLSQFTCSADSHQTINLTYIVSLDSLTWSFLWFTDIFVFSWTKSCGLGKKLSKST